MRLAVLIFKRGGIGFLLGAAFSALIVWRMAASGMEQKALPAQLLLSGFYGACCMAGTALYEIESWPLMKSTVLHWLITALLYVPIALGLGWVQSPLALVLMEGVMLAAFLMIWLAMFLRGKAEVHKLNDMIKRRQPEERMIKE